MGETSVEETEGDKMDELRAFSEKVTAYLSRFGLVHSVYKAKGNVLRADVSINTREGTFVWTLFAGKLKHNNRTPVTDVTVFISKVRQALLLVADVGSPMFAAINNPDGNMADNVVYAVEIPLIQDSGYEAVLAFAAASHLLTVPLEIALHPTSDLQQFMQEPAGSFGKPMYVLSAMEQFRQICPDVIFMLRITPNGFFWLRVKDPTENLKFMNFLHHSFEGAYVVIKATSKPL